jgi:sarcosine oxidase, subunit alpha
MSFHAPFRKRSGTAPMPDRPVSFRFDGRPYTGLAGDTLASALLANGVRVVARSFKFHRPRGVFSCGVEEPNALVQLASGARAVPSTRATLVELRDGMEAFATTGWPSVRFDVGRALDVLAPLWAAGFYNKTFMWPSWHAYEGFVRRMASGGSAPTGPDPDRYETRNLHCDVLVIGGGVAGLKAALEAAEAGSRVVLADSGTRLGGRAAWDGSLVDGVLGASWVKAMEVRLARANKVRVLTRTTATGCYGHNVVTLLESCSDVRHDALRERLFVTRTERIILATGAIEQPLIFSNNDRPGILLAGAAREYLRRHAVLPGRRVVIATNNDSAYELARDLKEAGVEVLAVADTRHDLAPEHVNEMRSLSVELLRGSIPVDTTGFAALKTVSVGQLTRDSSAVESVRRYACDCLAVSGGWNPTLHLYSQAGGQVGYDEASRALKPMASARSVTFVDVASDTAVGVRISPVGNTQRQWVDLRHDVTVADIELARRENYSAIEHLKRYTTVGMAADQGKTSHLAAIELMAKLRDISPSEIGHTTFRPPFTPVTLGAIAGRSTGERFSPIRTLPLHEWHAAHGAVLEDFGGWKRPAVYPRPGESRAQAIMREARAVRTGLGLLDGSSLGKIDVRGPDALEFLNRFYINDLMTLKPGRARYGIMLRESGVLFDDGMVVMMEPDRFLVTTTSGNAGRVASWLDEWHQCEWPRLRVMLTPVTEQWAVLSLTGSTAREVLHTLGADIDLTSAAFPHLGAREGHLLGHPVRIYRVSFTGELTYEINVPANAASEVWSALLEAGRPYGIESFGLDALSLLRMEKGYLHIGTDTDGTTVPDDVGWGRPAASKQVDFVGKRSLLLPENVRSDRRQLVGLRSDADIGVGSHLRLIDSTAATDGWVTSAGRAASTGEPIALALLRAGRSQLGAKVTVHNMGAVTQATVVPVPFFDPSGARLNA